MYKKSTQSINQLLLLVINTIAVMLLVTINQYNMLLYIHCTLAFQSFDQWGASETNDFTVICILKLGAWIIYSDGEDSQGAQPLPTITPKKQRKGV